jgi:hypothetical protein
MRLHLKSVVTVVIASATVALLFAEIVPAAAEIDPASALRGSLGVSLGDLSLQQQLRKSLAFAEWRVCSAVRHPRESRDRQALSPPKQHA